MVVGRPGHLRHRLDQRQLWLEHRAHCFRRRSLAQQDRVVVGSAGDERAAEALRDRHRHHEHRDDHGAQVVVGDQSHVIAWGLGGWGLRCSSARSQSQAPSLQLQSPFRLCYATRRSASTIFSRDAIVAGITAASRPITRLNPSPTTTLPLLTPKAGMNPPASPSASALITIRASAPPMMPPTTATRTPSPTTSRKIVADGNPSVRMTAISVVRSLTDIAIVLPATNSVVSTTASATLPSRTLRLPSIEANCAENACSVSVFVSYG